MLTVRQFLNATGKREAVTLRGWVKTMRIQKQVAFVALNDGSSLESCQVVVDPAILHGVSIGSSIAVSGCPQENFTNPKVMDLSAESITVLGGADDTFPIQRKTRMSPEVLRTMAHLRPKATTFAAVTRLRNTTVMSLHNTLQAGGFIMFETPTITTFDCEGEGNAFELHPRYEKFFGTPMYLTVSRQLHLESGACGLSRVYTLGPSFRAENSNTPRHLAEFQMLEVEQSFTTGVEDVMATAEACVRNATIAVLEKNGDDISHCTAWLDKGLSDKLSKSLLKPFAHLSYSEVIDILLRSGKTFAHTPAWGSSLGADQERYIAEEHCKSPVFIRDYPASVKPVYARANEINGTDERATCASFDLILPEVGEVVGGTLREERLELLEGKMNIPWYVDLRRYGTVPHGGFGLGVDRLVRWLSGVQNIRDVVPFPRHPNSRSF